MKDLFWDEPKETKEQSIPEKSIENPKSTILEPTQSQRQEPSKATKMNFGDDILSGMERSNSSSTAKSKE